MRLIPLSLFTLGLVWPSVIALSMENATVYQNLTAGRPMATGADMQNGTLVSMETATSTNGTSTQQNATEAPGTPESPTATSIIPTSITASTTPATSTTTTSTTAKVIVQGTAPSRSGLDNTGIVIILLIIVVGVVAAIACYITRKNSARYTVDLTTQPDDAQIPLSSVEPQEPVNVTSLNGMPTPDSVDVDPKEPDSGEKTADPQKEEAEKPPASADPLAPAPSPDSSSVEEAKGEGAAQAPAPAPAQAPVEPIPEGGTENESAVSNKTSMESLKDLNENSNNNIRKSAGELNPDDFTDVPLGIACSEMDDHLSSTAVPQKP